MFKGTAAMLVLAGAGMFAYFFVTDKSGKPDGERATTALQKVGDAAMDQGMAGVVKGRLAMSLGIDESRFLHSWFDDGKVLIYGLAPTGVTAEQLAADIRQIPGVREVEVQILGRPEFLDQPSETATHATQPPAGAAVGEGAPSSAAGQQTKGRRTQQ